MKSNYKKLGKYIEVVNIRNKDLKVEKLLGVSIRKVLMPSIANTVGTNMKTYKIIQRNQFAYGPVTSRNGDKISVALLEEYDEVIVSQAYTVFKVLDENVLNPEYLMMWFRRSEFDRYARFMSHGSARETFDWDEMLETELPIPFIEKQNEIVKEYNTIVNRIKLNEKLNKKLEETAQAIYKHWFVDFEFPNKNGKPYKSSGGKMVFNAELGKEIPEGWEVGTFEKVIDKFISKRGKSKSLMNLNQFSLEFKFPVISAMNVKNGKIVKNDTIPYINIEDYTEWMNPTLDTDDVILTSEAPLGESYYIAKNSDIAISQRLYCLRTKKNVLSGWYLFLWLKLPLVQKELEERSSGTTVAGIKLSELKKVSIVIPNEEVERTFVFQSKFIGNTIEIYNKENQILIQLKDLFLSKMSKVELEKEVEV